MSPDSDHRRARVATAAAYAVQGAAFAVVLTSIPAYKERLGMGDDVITLVILGVCVCAGLGSTLSGVASVRFGSRAVVTGGLLLAASGVLGIGLGATWPVFLAAIGVYGIALGAVDAAMNMQGIDVERSYGRSLLAAFFAANAAGGVVGALTVSGTAALGWGLSRSFPVVAVAVAVGALALRPGLLVRAGVRGTPFAPGVASPASVPGSGPAAVAPTAPIRRASIRRASSGVRPVGVAATTIVVLGVAMLAYPVADSATSSWSATFLRDVLGASAVVAPWGYAAYQATLIVSRLLGDRWVERWGRVRVVRAGGVLGALGFVAVAVAPGWPVAVLGLAATGLGLGVVAPLAFSAAGDRAREAVGPTVPAASAGVVDVATPSGVATPDDVAVVTHRTDVAAATDRTVARLNVFTYAGAVLGGVLTGVFATAHHLRIGFVVLGALASVSAILASVFREARTGTAAPDREPAIVPGGTSAIVPAERPDHRA